MCGVANQIRACACISRVLHVFTDPHVSYVLTVPHARAKIVCNSVCSCQVLHVLNMLPVHMCKV